MPTKAELRKELARLRQDCAERDKETAARAVSVSPPKPASDPATKTESEPTSGIDWAELLGGKGPDGTDHVGLLEQLTDELGELPQNKPLMTAAAAFGLGFILGRASK